MENAPNARDIRLFSQLTLEGRWHTTLCVTATLYFSIWQLQFELGHSNTAVLWFVLDIHGQMPIHLRQGINKRPKNESWWTSECAWLLTATQVRCYSIMAWLKHGCLTDCSTIAWAMTHKSCPETNECFMCLWAFCDCVKLPDISPFYGRRYLCWLPVSEVSVHVLLTPLCLGLGKAEHQSKGCDGEAVPLTGSWSREAGGGAMA